MYKLQLTIQVQNKELGDAYAELANLGFGKPEIIPMDDDLGEPSIPESQPKRRIFTRLGKSAAKAGKKPGAPRLPVGETLPDKVAKWLLANAPARINQEVLREASEACEGSRASYNYVSTMLRKWGVMSDADEYGDYTMHPEVFKKRLQDAEA